MKPPRWAESLFGPWSCPQPSFRVIPPSPASAPPVGGQDNWEKSALLLSNVLSIQPVISDNEPPMTEAASTLTTPPNIATPDLDSESPNHPSRPPSSSALPELPTTAAPATAIPTSAIPITSLSRSDDDTLQPVPWGVERSSKLELDGLVQLSNKIRCHLESNSPNGLCFYFISYQPSR